MAITAEGKVTITAQPSAAGTLVNGAKVYQQELKTGDVIRIGNSYLKLEEAADDTVADAAAQRHPDRSANASRPRDASLLAAGPVAGIGQSHAGSLPDRLARAGPVGTVFRAKDTKCGQDVALKILPPDFPADDAEVQRFVRVMKQYLPAARRPRADARCRKNGPYVWVSSELVPGTAWPS